MTLLSRVSDMLLIFVKPQMKYFRNTIYFENGEPSDKTLGAWKLELRSNFMKPEEPLYKI
jgi:hypothetical protein